MGATIGDLLLVAQRHAVELCAPAAMHHVTRHSSQPRPGVRATLAQGTRWERSRAPPCAAS
eukprot:7271310-Prymnesium_polylepis.1